MKYYLLALISCLTLTSCGSSSPDNALSKAEECLSVGDYEGARQLCYVIDDTAKIALSPSQLCRQALIYCRLSEASDNPDDMASATEFYSCAVQQSPDSVAAFLNAQSVDDIAHMRLIRSVLSALEAPCDIEYGEYPLDSISCVDIVVVENDSLATF